MKLSDVKFFHLGADKFEKFCKKHPELKCSEEGENIAVTENGENIAVYDPKKGYLMSYKDKSFFVEAQNEETEQLRDLVIKLHTAQASFQYAINEAVEKVVTAESLEKMVDSSPGDISARYWLIQFLEPLSRKELKSLVDGFLVQLLTEDQAKKLVKFLLVRFPHYYTGEPQLEQQEKPPLADIISPTN